jgi:hypothetical protein
MKQSCPALFLPLLLLLVVFFFFENEKEKEDENDYYMCVTGRNLIRCGWSAASPRVLRRNSW